MTKYDDGTPEQKAFHRAHGDGYSAGFVAGWDTLKSVLRIELPDLPEIKAHRDVTRIRKEAKPWVA